MQEIKRLVDRILRKNKIEHLPIPIEAIAENLGLEVRYDAVGEHVSGALVRSRDGVFIAVNSSQHSNRQRFTIAHELGHFFLHDGAAVHVDQDFRVNWRDGNSSTAERWEEIQANRFAAEILMPTEMLRRDLELVKSLDEADIRKLAKKYKVSDQAMTFRLANLGAIGNPD